MTKRTKRVLLTILLAVAVIAAAGLVAVRFAVRSADTGFVDFTRIERSPTGNDALLCSDGIPCIANRDFSLEPIALSAAEVTAKLMSLPQMEPRLSLVARDDATGRFVFVQRSFIFAYPDTINVRILPIDPDHAALAIYSRSNFGRGDFGVNRARLQRWLVLLGLPAVVLAPR